jgi:hypothetical protein
MAFAFHDQTMISVSNHTNTITETNNTSWFSADTLRFMSTPEGQASRDIDVGVGNEDGGGP